MDVFQYIDIINKVTVPVVLVAILWAIKEKWIVPGWIYTACEERAAKLEVVTNEYAAKLESKLDKLEQERWGSNKPNVQP